MSALIKSLKFSQIINRNPVAIYTVVRNHWNKDFKPGKFPETEEERRAAAKKYGMLPEEYKPYPDDGMGCGDYPHLPDVPVERRDIYYPYDMPEFRRNFQEPVHAEIDMYDETRYGSPQELRYPLSVMALMFVSVVGGSFFIYWLLDDHKMFRPVLRKQLPADGVHYTFEPKST